MSSIQVSIAQAKAEFAALVSQAEAGDEIIVTRHGKPVARLSALPAEPVVFGDLAGLALADDLELPEDVIDGFLAR
jgi:prevent-host-death family protein